MSLRDEERLAAMRAALSAPEVADDDAVRRVLERSGDRTTRDWLRHLPEADAAAAWRVERAVIDRIHQGPRRARRWAPVVIGVAIAGAAAAAALLDPGAPVGADTAPVAGIAQAGGGGAEGDGAEGDGAVGADVTARSQLREAYRLLNLGAGEAAALDAVALGLTLAPPAEDRAELLYLQLSVLDRMDRPEDTLDAAAIYVTGGWAAQRAEVLGTAARYAAMLEGCDAALPYLDALRGEFPDAPPPSVDCPLP